MIKRADSKRWSNDCILDYLGKLCKRQDLYKGKEVKAEGRRRKAEGVMSAAPEWWEVVSGKKWLSRASANLTT